MTHQEYRGREGGRLKVTVYCSKSKRLRLRSTSTLRTAENRKNRPHGCLTLFAATILPNSTTSTSSTCTSMIHSLALFINLLSLMPHIRRKPLKFEKYLKVSNNYFDKRWSGARRIKNVAIVLEWTPSYRLTDSFPTPWR